MGRVVGRLGCTDGRVLGRVEGRVEGCVLGRVLGRAAGFVGWVDGRPTVRPGWVDGRVPTPVLGLEILPSKPPPVGRRLVSSRDGAPPLLGIRLSWLSPTLLQEPPERDCQAPDFGSSLCTEPLRPT